MTKEQEARIKLLKDFTKMDFSNPMGWTGYYDTELKELSEAVETALNIIKEKDKEIEQKVKQIDLMAKAFKQDDVRTVEEIIEYFKELAERKSEE